MKLTMRVSDDWYIIERADHDGRSWLEPTDYGLAFQTSSRFSDADVEGDASDMLCVAAAIESRSGYTAKWCSVDASRDPVRFRSPRNSRTDGECTYVEAVALAADPGQIGRCRVNDMTPAMAAQWTISAIRAEMANLRTSATRTEPMPLSRAVEIGLLCANNCATEADIGNADRVSDFAIKAAAHFAYVAASLRRGVPLDREPVSVRFGPIDTECAAEAEEAAAVRAEQDRRSQVISALTDARAVPTDELRAMVPGLIASDLDALERAGCIEVTGDGWALTPLPGARRAEPTCAACSGPLVGGACPTCAEAAATVVNCEPGAMTEPRASQRKRRTEPPQTAAEWASTPDTRDARRATVDATAAEFVRFIEDHHAAPARARGWPAIFAAWLSKHRAAERAGASSAHGHEEHEAADGRDERREVEGDEQQGHAGAMPVAEEAVL